MLCRPVAPSPGEDWPSPVVNHTEFGLSMFPNVRVRVFSVVGELLDSGLVTEAEAAAMLEIALRGEREVMQMADLIDSRSTRNGKAQFLKLLISISKTPHAGFTTPSPAACFFPHATPFVEFPSPLMRSASPPLRFPTALRPHSTGMSQKPLDLARAQSEEVDPKLSPSTNVGSSMETSPPAAPDCTACRE
jgi:hypothetical protein